MEQVREDMNNLWEGYAEYVAENAEYRKELERQIDDACKPDKPQGNVDVEYVEADVIDKATGLPERSVTVRIYKEEV